jgi:hypothetical protein
MFMRILPEGSGKTFAKLFKKYFVIALAVFVLAFFVSLPHLHGSSAHRHFLAAAIALAVDAIVGFATLIIALCASLKNLS